MPRPAETVPVRNELIATAAQVVTAAYRGLLDREPDLEGLTAHTARLQQDRNIEAMLASMVAGAEFRQKIAGPNLPVLLGALGLATQPREVKVQATDGQLDRLFERIRQQWTQLGDTEPNWSVLVDEKFKRKNFAENEEMFYASGHSIFAMIQSFTRRAGREINSSATVLELGCGTGRASHVLADKFARVIAVDVSPGNMRLCQQKMRQLGKTNITYILLKSPRDIQNIPAIDFFFSMIVLQHNPPPVAHYLLSEIFKKITPSGSVLFQVPTHTPGYTFDLNEYLASPPGVMEMHCVPMPAVFALLQENRLKPREVVMDGFTGWLGSHTFFAVRE